MSGLPKGFDPVIHVPSRLQLVAILAGVSEAEFATLREMAAISDSVLSKHLSALAEAGYVKVMKGAVNGRQRTWAKLTHRGRRAFNAHIAALNVLACLAGANVAGE
ncbi:transcriptional regulator [Neoasaia chiangmaiensis NBRC 101099]|uniref:MarR family transcriptional regulator n=1 Tax=Neoasaia chiangmaiensis TaxID=320497 RepID=A0A1U9KRG0_9PROT|nr:transcriptional regulator [Neoasaia chiangmaiensis]AQS88396.1 MarR family transcriptional regulator [Neoasaia chiangmaiensis]GBR39356.1 transcriptional regulator [Neoasaia chiangmaiensis NBRC 101099]GEN14540.1 MarR family transcriptional regulator [Neoasaia chiangmaiensis]